MKRIDHRVSPLTPGRRTVAGLVLALGALGAGCDSTSMTPNPSPDLGQPLPPGPDMPPPGPDLAKPGADLAGARGELTLASCTTNIAADVPAFYKTYFRCVNIVMNAGNVVISTQNLPPHKTNYYGQGHPNYTPFDTSRGAMYRPNPNLLQAKPFSVTIPTTPVAKVGLTITAALVDGVAGNSREEYRMGPVGAALDSVALFNALAAPGDNIEQEKYTFDSYNAHPTPTSEYHYHTSTPGPLEVLKAAGVISNVTPGSAEVELYGVLCDGTLVLGCTELDGTAPAGALDAQGGHRGNIKDKAGAAFFSDRYHTHVCPTRAGFAKFTPEIQFYSSCTITR